MHYHTCKNIFLVFDRCFCGRLQYSHIVVSHTPDKDCPSHLKNLAVDAANGSMPYRSLQDFGHLRHTTGPSDVGEATGEWNAEEHLAEFPTDAFGEIQFKGTTSRLCRSKVENSWVLQLT